MEKTVRPFFDAPDFEKGLESGIPGEWTVAKEYGIVDGRIVGFGRLTEAKEFYRPILRHEILSDLVKVDPDDEKQILDFVSTYGALGGYNNYDWPQEDPLEWFQHSVRVLNAVSNLIAIVKEKDERSALSYREEEANRHTIDGIPVSKLVHRGDYYHSDTWVEINNPLEWTQYLIAGIINDNIRGMTRKPVLTPDGIRSYFTFTSLLDVVYWQILNAEEGGNLKLCKMCKRPFISTDGRQRFCPKRLWQKDTSESQCSILYRQKKYRGEI